MGPKPTVPSSGDLYRSRLDARCKTLAVPLVISDVAASLYDSPLQSLGWYELRGADHRSLLAAGVQNLRLGAACVRTRPTRRAASGTELKQADGPHPRGKLPLKGHA